MALAMIICAIVLPLALLLLLLAENVKENR